MAQPLRRIQLQLEVQHTFAVMSVQPLSRKNWRAASLPPATIAFSSSGVHLSSSVDLRSTHRAAQKLIMKHQARRHWQARRAKRSRGRELRTVPGKLTDLTKLMCVPIRRCCPEQSKQIKMPYVTEAHVAFLAPQSKQFCNRAHAHSSCCGDDSAELEQSEGLR